jgi:L-ribulose-5-phosphate 4-epimerase
MAAAFLAIPLATAQTAPETPAAIEATPDGTTAQAARPFSWGRDAGGAVVNAIALEAVAAMAQRTLALEPAADRVQEALLRRHFDRKHGPGAYYGQPATAPVRARNEP